MSFPSQRRESVSKGDSNEISRFLDEKYPGHYKVYNLCKQDFKHIIIWQNKEQNAVIMDTVLAIRSKKNCGTLIEQSPTINSGVYKL